MIVESKVIIAVGAHPDDIELGCGGTVRLATKAGKRVIAVIMTKGEQGGDPNVRCEETRQALSILGVKEIYFGDFPDTEVPNSRKAISFLESFCDKVKPEIVLTHTVNSMHQDHRQVGWLSMAAFRYVPTILAYETTRVTSSFSPVYFVEVDECIKDKWAALQCHKTQRSKDYLAYSSVINLASFRGRQANVSYAEAFEVVRFVEKASGRKSKSAIHNIE